MDWFTLGLNGWILAATSILQYTFAARFTKKQKESIPGQPDRQAPRVRPWHYALYFILLCAGGSLVSMHNSGLLSFGVSFAAIYGMSRFALKNSRSVSCVTAILTLHIPQLSFGIINPLENLFFPYALGRTSLLRLLVILASLLALSLCLCCYGLMVKYFSIQDGQPEPYIWLLLPSELFFFAVEFYILNTAYGRILTVPYSIKTHEQISLFLLQSLSLGALFCTLYAYKRTCSSFQSQASLALLTQETNAQKTYVAQAQMRYEQTRAFRHDLKNHLSVLEGLLNKEYFEQARSYLQKLDINTSDLSFPVHTGSPVIDILLADKWNLAQTADIDMEVSLTLPQPCQTVDDLDLCVLFSNALDNAVQACIQADGPRWIHIRGEQQGDFYMLDFENTCSPKQAQPPAIGTGLSNVKAIAAKYGGTITIERGPSIFSLSILLNISLHPENRSGQTT